jgi:hypothetical protein
MVPSFLSGSSRVLTWTSFSINSKSVLPPSHIRKVLKIWNFEIMQHELLTHVRYHTEVEHDSEVLNGLARFLPTTWGIFVYLLVTLFIPKYTFLEGTGIVNKSFLDLASFLT